MKLEEIACDLRRRLAAALRSGDNAAVTREGQRALNLLREQAKRLARLDRFAAHVYQHDEDAYFSALGRMHGDRLETADDDTFGSEVLLTEVDGYLVYGPWPEPFVTADPAAAVNSAQEFSCGAVVEVVAVAPCAPPFYGAACATSRAEPLEHDPNFMFQSTEARFFHDPKVAQRCFAASREAFGGEGEVN